MRPCIQALDFEILEQVRKIVAGKGVPKCLIFDVDSIFGVEILSENFPIIRTPVGLRNFHDIFAVHFIRGDDLRRSVTN